ncbi:hypothetical protein [Allokutzneria albata]|uniref:Uncharacterized protein n=1 Tax=Allokutzneria albata TaxID=211114 RepID=A0A1H0A4Y6_ALLAB|nr:hypothetical protein [Allokutzneria albata]SDN28517.1 hypothetical protein SAMN04489726_5878 [Allokutzneria albata]
MSLDQELRRLFDDERLGLPVRPDAEQTVLRGVSRRRARRRTLAVGGAAVAVVAALSGGIALSGFGRTASAPPATEQPDRSGAPETVDPVADDTTFGPHGLGRLKLGMSEAEAVATGLIKANSKPDSEGGCRGYNYAGENIRYGYYSLLFSAKHGLVRLEATPGAKTPEGIGIGSRLGELNRVYTGNKVKHGAVGERVTDVPGNPKANYWVIVRNDVLTEVRLELKEQDCYR